MIIDEDGQTFLKFRSLKCLYNISKKKLEMKLILTFLDIKVSYKVILSFLMSMIKHSQSTSSNKFAISL